MRKTLSALAALCLWITGLMLPAAPGAAAEAASAGNGETDSILSGTGTEEENGEQDASASPTVGPPENIILLKYGSKGEEVRILQLRLAELGYLTGEADGIYGDDTREAVRAFQRRNGLSVDGIAGKQTQTRLYSEDAVPAPQQSENPSAEDRFLYQRRQENRQRCRLSVLRARHLQDSSVVRIRAVRWQNQQENRIQHQVKGDHHAVADQNLENAVSKMVAERVEVPPQPMSSKEQHIDCSAGIDHHIDHKVRQVCRLRQ